MCIVQLKQAAVKLPGLHAFVICFYDVLQKQLNRAALIPNQKAKWMPPENEDKVSHLFLQYLGDIHVDQKATSGFVMQY